VTTTGALAVAKGYVAANGDLQVGDAMGEVYLKGRIMAEKALFGNGSALKVVATDPALPALLTATAIEVDGTLTVLLADNHKLHLGDSVTLFQAPAITGAFDNVSFGDRISTQDGAGSFRLIQESGKVLLADFQSDIRLGAVFDVAGSSLTLSFPSALSPRIETSTNLVEWSEVAGLIFGVSGDRSSWTTSIPKMEPQRFYRLAR
jgi:hypothetical protein